MLRETLLKNRALLATILLCLPFTGFAHHSQVPFDKFESVTVTGKVSRFVWRNPHLLLTLEVENNGQAETWNIEGSNTVDLVKSGFSRDSISKGDIVTARMHPLKSGKPGGYLQGVILSNGTALGMEYVSDAVTDEGAQQALTIPALTEYVPPPAGDTWQKREARTRPAVLPLPPRDPNLPLGALDADNLAIERPAPPFDVTGTWAFRGEEAEQPHYGRYEFKPHPKWTNKGQKIYDEFLTFAKRGEPYAEPTRDCYPAGMPRFMTRFGSLMMLQHPTAIFMVSRLNNEYRVIYLDGRERRPKNLRNPSWNGESIGYWEDDTLVIETEGFTNENHLIQQGVFTGDQLKIVERISLINNGNTMKIDFSLTDPEYWVGEWKHTKFRDRMLSGDVNEANCLLEDSAILPGSGS